MFYERNINSTLEMCSNEFAVITIYGARQVGKSTLVKQKFSNFNYVTLDDLELRDFALTNPKLFLETYKYPIIIDEIQKAPVLLDYIKINVDKYKYDCLINNKNINVIYILTGSNQFELNKGNVESLAGRTALLKLSSLSLNEILCRKSSDLFDPNINTLLEKEKNSSEYIDSSKIFEMIFKGGMPELVSTKIDRDVYFSSYISTYIEKDIKSLIDIGNESNFLRFLTYIAFRTSCQINYEDISKNVGVDNKTIKRWISILETSGIIVLLEPYMKNVSDRIVKTPKLYFLDTGLCAYLCKWQDARMLEFGAMNGAFYETYVVSEIIKSYYNKGYDIKNTSNRKLYYYRDRDQKEVDLIIETDRGIYPIEIKKGINPVSYNKNFKVLEKYGQNVNIGLVIDSCEKIRPINDKVYYCPITMIGL